MRVTKSEGTVLITSLNGATSRTVYGMFRRLLSVCGEVGESEDAVLVKSDIFDFDIMLNIRDGYIYCEVHTDKSGNHSYTVIYSWKELLKDVVKKLNEVVFESEVYATLSKEEQLNTQKCLKWYYIITGEKMPDCQIDMNISDVRELLSIDRKDLDYYYTKYKDTEGFVDSPVFADTVTDLSLAFMNWDKGILGIYAEVDKGIVGIAPFSKDTLVKSYCEIVRLAIEIKTGYRDIEIEDDVLYIGVEEDGDELPETEEEIDNFCIDLGYNLDKYEIFKSVYVKVVKTMEQFGFTLEDFEVKQTGDSYEVPKYLHLVGGEWL